MDPDLSGRQIRLDDDLLPPSQSQPPLSAIACDSPSSTYISASPATPFIPLLNIGSVTGGDALARKAPKSDHNIHHAVTTPNPCAVSPVPEGSASGSRGNTKAIVSASQAKTRGQGVVALESLFKPQRTLGAARKIKNSPQGDAYSLGDPSLLATKASSLTSSQSRKADVETSIEYTDALGLFDMGSGPAIDDPANDRLIEDWWRLYTTLEDSNTKFPPLIEVTSECDPFPNIVWKRFSPSVFGHFDSESFRRGQWRQKTFGPSFHIPRDLSPSHPFSMVSFVRGVRFADILPLGENSRSEVTDAWFWETIQLG